jgi:hypothetical protein
MRRPGIGDFFQGVLDFPVFVPKNSVFRLKTVNAFGVLPTDFLKLKDGIFQKGQLGLDGCQVSGGVFYHKLKPKSRYGNSFCKQSFFYTR